MTPLEVALALGAYEDIEMKIINVQGQDMFDIKRLDEPDSPHFVIAKDQWGSYLMKYLLHNTDNLVSILSVSYNMQINSCTMDQFTKWIDEKTVEMCKKVEVGIKGLKQAFDNAENLPYGTAWMHESLKAIRDTSSKLFLVQMYLNFNPFQLQEMYVYNPNGKKEKDKTFYVIDKYQPAKMAFKRKTKDRKLCPVAEDYNEVIKQVFPELF